MLQKEQYVYNTMDELFMDHSWGHHKKSPCPGCIASNITIRHLLGMQSGVPDYDTNLYKHLQFSHSELDFTPLDIFDFVGAPLEFAPGTQTSYCSVNFMP